MSIHTIMNRVFDYALTAMTAVPEKFRAPIRNELRPDKDPLMAATSLIELVYANRTQLPPAVLNVIADLADEAAKTNLAGMGDGDRRAKRIADVIRKMPGVTPRPVESTEDPIPLEEKIIP